MIIFWLGVMTLTSSIWQIIRTSDELQIILSNKWWGSVKGRIPLYRLLDKSVLDQIIN